MNPNFKTTAYVICIFSTLLFSQPGGRGCFNPANMPKIGVLQGIVVDSVSTNPIPYASISILNIISLYLECEFRLKKHTRLLITII